MIFLLGYKYNQNNKTEVRIYTKPGNLDRRPDPSKYIAVSQLPGFLDTPYNPETVRTWIRRPKVVYDGSFSNFSLLSTNSDSTY